MVHYIALIACYICCVKKMVIGSITFEDISEVILLSVAPMLHAKDEAVDDKNNKKIASEFSAEIHANHFCSMFSEFYDLNLEEWALCCIADNTLTNNKTARLLKITHVGCLNHLQNIDTQEWIMTTQDLKEVVDKIIKVMKEARTLKNRSILSESTELVALLPKITHWSSVRIMLDRFIKIYMELLQFQEKMDSVDMKGADHP